MANIQITPFVFFQGNCREAMSFYHSIFGGSLTMRTYGEVMGDNGGAGAGGNDDDFAGFEGVEEVPGDGARFAAVSAIEGRLAQQV